MAATVAFVILLLTTAIIIQQVHRSLVKDLQPLYLEFDIAHNETGLNNNWPMFVNPRNVDYIYNHKSLEANEDFQPLTDIAYNKIGPNNNRSAFVIPRRAYYDNRTTFYGISLNRLVILIMVHDDARNAILACECNGFRTTSMRNFTKDTSWAKKSFRIPITHRLMMLMCLGLPKKAIVNGTFPRVIYKKPGESRYSRIETEKPLVLVKHLDDDESTFDRGKSSVVVCSTVFEHPYLFDQWLRYQKTLKVDMVHLNVEYSFYKSATLLYPFLKKSLENGFVQMEVWNDIIGSRAFYHEQLEKYQDCLYRYIGVFEYGVFYDYDDFLVPRLPSHKNIRYYLDKLLVDEIGSVRFDWIQLLCRPLLSRLKKLPDGNLTRILSGYKYSVRKEKKSAHKLNSIDCVYIHHAFSHLPRYTYLVVDKHLAYVGHVRNSFKLCFP